MRIGVALALLLFARTVLAADAESLAFVDLEGAPVRIAAPAPGAAVVVHYWATWCTSCKHELPDLDRAASACRDADVEVITVDVGESAAEVRDFLGDRPFGLRVLLDPKGKAWRASGGREMPANLIWTAERQTWALGPSSEAQWRERLASLGCAPVGPDAPRDN